MTRITKTAIVTGATSGLGLVTALALARHGMHAILPARDTERARRAVESIATGTSDRFALTRLLLPLLQPSPAGRVVTVGSMEHLRGVIDMDPHQPHARGELRGPLGEARIASPARDLTHRDWASAPRCVVGLALTWKLIPADAPTAEKAEARLSRTPAVPSDHRAAVRQVERHR